MKKKISFIMVIIFLFNIFYIGRLSEKLGFRNVANASVREFITREDIEKFEGRIATSIRHTVIINNNNEVDIVGGHGANYGYFDENEWSDIVKVDVGNYNTIGLKRNGDVVSYGGVLDKNWSNVIDVTSGDYHIVAVKADGTVIAEGENTNGQCNIYDWKDIIKVTAGNGHTVGLTENGKVLAVGNNYSGQCAVNEWSDIVQIAAGRTHTVGLRSDGTVIATGYNGMGECNVGDWNNIVSIAAGNGSTIGLKNDGTVIATGDVKNLDDIKMWSNIVAISADTSIVALRSDGTILGAGDNTYGEISLKSWDDIKYISAGNMFTAGLKNDGTIITIGETYQGKIKVAEKWNDIIDIDAGSYSLVGLKKDGTVVDTLNDVTNWNNIIQVSAGNSHTVGLKTDGTVIASGDNNYGELDVYNWDNIIQVSAGLGITVGLRSDGTVVATGNNRYGQCNVEDWNDIIKVEITDEHIVGLKKDGTVVATGNNYYGQCNVYGFTDIVDIAVGSCHTVALKADGIVVAVGGIEGIGACSVDKWSNIQSITAGDNHTVGITKDAKLVSTGDNRSGQSSFITTKDNVINIDKEIYKINEPIYIEVNNTDFYNIYGTDVDLNGELYSLENIEGKYFLNYTPNKSGNINIKLPRVLDLFGNSYSEYSLLKVMPLKEISTNKTKVSNGESITINITFTEPIKNDFTIDLSGAIKSKDISLNEVSGTNSTKFIASYIIPNTVNTGNVDIIIKNLTDNNGVIYNSYTEESVFTKDISESPVNKEDVNKDNKIDALDLALVGLNYNKKCNDLECNFDINNDGIVDIFDLVLVSRKM